MDNKKGKEQVTLGRLMLYFLRLGALGFGGPIALAEHMQRDLVPRGWISDEEFVEGLAFSQMMPGPLAAQLAIWIGYIRFNVLGATLIGFIFILPPFLLVLAIAALYKEFNGLPIVQALFYGIGPVVIAIIALSAFRLARKTVGKDWVMWIIFGVVMLITLFLRAEFVILFIIAGLIGLLIKFPISKWKHKSSKLPLIIFSAAVGSIQLPVLLQLSTFFLIAGAFTFGSGLAIVPFLHQGVVVQHHWLNETQFLDAVAVGIITPGPVVITAAFIGYLVAGFLGALVSALSVFLPVYLFVILIGRLIVRHHDHPALQGFVKGATSAATGAIAGAAIILGRGSIKDIPTAVIGLASLLILMFLRIPEPILVVAGALVGILLRH